MSITAEGETVELKPQQQEESTTFINPTTNEEEVKQEQTTTTSSIQEYIKSLDQDYFTEIKENAKLKVFTVNFDGGIKKIYTRRKVTMKEIAEIEKRREILKSDKGSALDK